MEEKNLKIKVIKHLVLWSLKENKMGFRDLHRPSVQETDKKLNDFINNLLDIPKKYDLCMILAEMRRHYSGIDGIRDEEIQSGENYYNKAQEFKNK